MWTNSDIIAKSWLIKEVVNAVLLGEMEVEKIFLIGSYASGKQTEKSDLDFLVQLRGKKSHIGMIYPCWDDIEEVQKRVGKRIHVVFGTETATKSLHEKNKGKAKDYSYREIKLPVMEEKHVSV